MLKMALFVCAINEKCCGVAEDGAFAFFFCPHPGEFDSSRVPTPENLRCKAKKMSMPVDQPGGGGKGVWAQLELTDAQILITSHILHISCQLISKKSVNWLFCGHEINIRA